jgi:hypothetical protein
VAAASIRADILETASRIESLQREALGRKFQRDALAVAVAAIEERLGATHQELDGQVQADTDLDRSLLEARARLEDLERSRVAIETAPAPAVEIESYPTPLSRPVDGRELHFQLRAGRLTFIPLDTLIEEFRSDAQHKIYKLRDLPEFTETIGPEGGFRLRYTIERVDVTPETPKELRGGRWFARLKRWTLIPVSEDLGETVAEALQEGSQYRLALADRRAKGATVTVWTYADSFEAFRQIRKDLYQRGFPVAARPLPEGVLIGGSPEGSKSAAE